MNTDQAARFAAHLLHTSGNEAAFDVDLDDPESVVNALREMGCFVRQNLFLPNRITVVPPKRKTPQPD